MSLFIMGLPHSALQYCQETLANNKPAIGFEGVMHTKKTNLERNLMQCNGSFMPTKEGFQTLLKKFKLSRKQNYDFLVRSSKEFQDVVFKFSKLIIQKEEFPDSFKETTLHMIFKGGTGKREKLSDNRFVHSKFWFPRLVEGLIVGEGLKKPLLNGSSMYQIGGQPGHRCEELIFVMKAIISKYRSEGKCLILQTSDFQNFSIRK